MEVSGEEWMWISGSKLLEMEGGRPKWLGTYGGQWPGMISG